MGVQVFSLSIRTVIRIPSYMLYNGCMKASKRAKKGATKKGVIGYIRVSTEDQADSGLGLEAQRRLIISECERRGYELLEIIEDAGISGKNLNRVGIQRALTMLSQGEGDILLCAKLDRLARSVADICQIGDMAQYYGWNLILLDCAIDTTTPYGKAQLNMMATFSQLERELIGLRTKEALAVKKSQGVRLGRPHVIKPEVRKRVLEMRESGMTLKGIVARLNTQGVEPTQGSKFHLATVQRILAQGVGA
jgi:DNA invertase Pin-like site-specific DNA recombinase